MWGVYGRCESVQVCVYVFVGMNVGCVCGGGGVYVSVYENICMDVCV